MDRQAVFAKLVEIMKDIFDDDELIVDDASTADDVADWDSANHVRLMIAVEEEFGIRFESDEITAPETVGELVELISSKLA